MSEVSRRTAFNSPLETGMRSLAILLAAFPESYDLQKLVELDYLTVHTKDAGGPDSLHAPLPLRAGELLVRRELVERGLMLMVSRALVERTVSSEGITFSATDKASPFVALLEAEYALALLDRAKWTVERFGTLAAEEIRGVTRAFFEGWASQFQPPQTPGLLS
ncbi:ABC-three component system middle component 2 [Mesorhizobium sp. WSM4887]|uniref:ABC-three component system middle component 2 n=1 Tax=Mesorhizobium sp. WSM4887 TaxID=3038543 RepID=UPI0032429708